MTNKALVVYFSLSLSFTSAVYRSMFERDIDWDIIFLVVRIYLATFAIV